MTLYLSMFIQSTDKMYGEAEGETDCQWKNMTRKKDCKSLQSFELYSVKKMELLSTKPSWHMNIKVF